MSAMDDWTDHLGMSPTPAPKIEKADYRGIPAHVCPCGSRMFNLKVIFDDYDIGMYLLDMTCVMCESLLTAPTEIDRPE